MARINDILSAQVGEYKWGVNDCLHTAYMIIENQGYTPPDYSHWYKFSEQEAIIRAKNKYGSLLEAHLLLFRKAGLLVYETSSTITPGDIILLGGQLVCDQLGVSKDVKDLTMLGFVSESYEVLTWFEVGLRPLSNYEYQGLIRCP